jgi:DNA-directed RNA polymerase specialized sigma24 family protein
LRDILKKLMMPWNKLVRDIVMYTYWDGYTQDEISTMTGIAPSTIRKHLTKFRRQTEQWKIEKLEGEHAY